MGKKSRGTASLGEAARRARARDRSGQVAPGSNSSVETLEEIFAGLRSGAANVAGVTFQTALASLLLASGRSESSEIPPIASVRPEGFEDIDCELVDGSWMLVQSKQRSLGSRPIGIAETAAILAHAVRIESAQDYRNDVSRIAIVTNGRFADGLPTTGWSSTIDPASAQALLKALEGKLLESKLDSTRASWVLERTHTVATSSSLRTSTNMFLEDEYQLHPAVSSIVSANLLSDLADMSGEQRASRLTSSLTLAVSDLDAMVQSLVADVNVEHLDEATRSGVCEFADFSLRSDDSPDQFYAGIKVVPGHIAADLDVIRVEECEAILDALAARAQVIVAGPSGTGKSGLLWRAASLLREGPRIVRVLRVETPEDSRVLVRFIAQLKPRSDRRVLVCIDDLGRPHTEAWPEARDRLLELPGVQILGACRQEDLLPSLTAGAVLLDSRLTDRSARLIYQSMVAAKMQLSAEPEEAINRGAGLLMEFVAIATTGHRLRAVLAAQVLKLRSDGSSVASRVLAVVVALHTLGHRVDASALPHALGESESEVSSGLALLQSEHLATSDDGTTWRALHDLRAEVLLELLHETPPPTLARTYARSIQAVPAALRPVLYRRAVIRLARKLSETSASDLGKRLADVQRVLSPIAEAIRDDVVAIGSGSNPSSREYELLSALLESSERVDVVAYVAATWSFVKSNTEPTIDPAGIYLLTYTTRFAKGFDAFDWITKLAAGLPEWSSAARDESTAAVPSDVLMPALKMLPLAAAIRLSEVLEGRLILDARAAAEVFRHHASSADGQLDLNSSGMFAQLTATLARLSGADENRLLENFGTAKDRATSAVSADPFGFEVSVRQLPIAQLSDSRDHGVPLTRRDADAFTEIGARAFARLSDDSAADHAYKARPGEDPGSINAQAVFLAARLFDVCPEAEVVQVEIVYPNLSTVGFGHEGGGFKRLRAGAVPREVDTARSVAVQAAIAELRSSERWTARCREQAQIAQELLRLLADLPARLNRIDNIRRRREWQKATVAAATRVTQMPGMPLDGPLIDPMQMQLVSAAEVDRLMREGTNDPSRKALDLLATTLLQVADKLDDLSVLAGLSMRLAEAASAIHSARLTSVLPAFVGVGETLPRSLEESAWIAARMMLARTEEDLSSLFESPSIDAASLDAALLEHSQVKAKLSEEAVRNRIDRVGAQVAKLALSETLAPLDPLNRFVLNVAVDIRDWAAVDETVKAWTPAERDAAGAESRIVFIATIESVALPIGLTISGKDGSVFPLLPSEHEAVASALQLVAPARRFQTRAEPVLKKLINASYAKVRAYNRPSSWPKLSLNDEKSSLEGSMPSFTHSDPPSWRTCVEALISLAKIVDAESGSEPNLASELANTSVSTSSKQSPSKTMELVTIINATALSADLDIG